MRHKHNLPQFWALIAKYPKNFLLTGQWCWVLVALNIIYFIYNIYKPYMLLECGMDQIQKKALTCKQSVGVLRQVCDNSGINRAAGPHSYGCCAMRLSSSKACSSKSDQWTFHFLYIFGKGIQQTFQRCICLAQVEPQELVRHQ